MNPRGDASSLGELPSELLRQMANSMLNPAEQTRLSSCSRRLRSLLPSYLRIKISCARDDDGVLQQDFFVSPVAAPAAAAAAAAPPPGESSSRFLLSSESLLFGREYHFWSFDYQRGNKTYLGRHTRHAREHDEDGRFRYLYSVGLRPRAPNQTWKVVGGEDGDVVMWGQEIALTVGGLNRKPRQPDSLDRGTLCCAPKATSGPLWFVSEGDGRSHRCVGGGGGGGEGEAERGGEASKLKLLPCNQYSPSPHVPEKELIVHAIPDVCDEGEYMLHSPCSTKNGTVHSDGFHVVVDFSFWISKGIMFFSSPVLPFSLGIPILETDVLGTGSCPLANLLQIRSARWGCVIYYMAVAADVGEGKSLNMDRFLQRVTEHRDHRVIVVGSIDLVYINVLHKQVKTKAEPVARNDDALWRFLLSW